jgi:hypothetical protein
MIDAIPIKGSTPGSMNGLPGIGSGCVRLDDGLPQRNESALLVGQPEPDFPSGN